MTKHGKNKPNTNTSQDPSSFVTIPYLKEIIELLVKQTSASLSDTTNMIVKQNEYIAKLIDQQCYLTKTIGRHEAKIMYLEEELKKCSSNTSTPVCIEAQNNQTLLLGSTADLSEQCDRLKRSTNIVLMGVPEDSNAIKTCKEILDIALPNNDIWVTDSRIGTKQDGKIRPIRICLNGPNQVLQAVGNYKKVRQKAKFANISIRRDETKRQQAERKEKSLPATTSELKNLKPDDAIPLTNNSSDTIAHSLRKNSQHSTRTKKK